MTKSLLLVAAAASALLAGCASETMTTAMAPASETMDIYFPYASTGLTTVGHAEVHATALAYKDYKLSKVALVGNADTSGSAKSNDALSARRAAVVANQLVRHGVPKSIISTDAKGEANLAVATGDGVKNAENRRVTVMMYR